MACTDVNNVMCNMRALALFLANVTKDASVTFTTASYFEVGDTVNVKNKGAGSIPSPGWPTLVGDALMILLSTNFGLETAAECLGSSATDVPPGATLKVKGLSEGDHRFQCCIHPWMRTLIKVLPDD